MEIHFGYAGVIVETKRSYVQIACFRGTQDHADVFNQNLAPHTRLFVLRPIQRMACLVLASTAYSKAWLADAQIKIIALIRIMVVAEYPFVRNG
jgi:hypothetical protein